MILGLPEDMARDGSNMTVKRTAVVSIEEAVKSSNSRFGLLNTVKQSAKMGGSGSLFCAHYGIP